MQQPIYHSRDIRAWEQRWFAQGNSAYGLMQQVAWTLSQRLISILRQTSPSAAQQQHKPKIAICCGSGNNAGDGYLTAVYLTQAGFEVEIYAAQRGTSLSLQQAYLAAKAAQLKIITGFDFQQEYDVYIDALFGIGLNRDLDQSWQQIIHRINQRSGLKIAIDIPSGLDANTGQALACAIKADYSFSVLGLKAGLYTGQAQEYTGQVELLALIPPDPALKARAYLSPQQIYLPQRQAFAHKGNYGHVLIVGGHANMGGAVMMAAEAASATGAGKVTVVCHAKHHSAILSRAPNLMLADIDHITAAEIEAFIQRADAVSFGMGLGRDAWAGQHFQNWFKALSQSTLDVVYDADALWFLAKQPLSLHANHYATPHVGEAATLLNTTIAAIESDRIFAIQQLQQKYAGQWVLKGSGSLILEQQLWICSAGNAGMGTGGMGDVLAGMIAGLKAQFHTQIALHQIVSLHAMAGDVLAQHGMRGLQAQDMKHAIYQLVNVK
ncbi:bifunctional ADP-dependent NAD(P)H-hydrate dehydratase/NAD(P)H-hydrate epimerase [Acinetobacter larvae]|uniref:Bifunctional NAD(P)H-hydrate repair enzyme n=1 Tax=Acinetobacter larvae TaxID=1789224 RepID=A0A1B2M3Y1_9GAMM|nr:bifunctional ADP-dependent NAD(P)H-hydrate dehydratase/NAD(P)H-hydrate epimerase [Acinetobacter larvae]AOA59916.1 bifunctional ADP-dependent (S)-NAD(P)H-hydrate dehydratase/NAD(P)H-hydrate epimerase [Acinetobacter larvae]